RGLYVPRRGHLDAGEQRQAFRQSFSVTRAVPGQATPHDDRFLNGRAGACGVARFAQPERKIVQARGETRLIVNRAAMYQAAISIDRLLASTAPSRSTAWARRADRCTNSFAAVGREFACVS